MALGDRSVVNDNSLRICNSGTGTIVDSGTTDTYLPKIMAKEFSRAWEAVTGQVYNYSS